MSNKKFETYMKRHLLNEETDFEKQWKYEYDKNNPNPIPFSEFMENLRNYSSDDDRGEMLTFLTKVIMKSHTDNFLVNLMIDMAEEFQRDQEGNHITGEMDVNENIETLLSPEDLKYYRAHRDEIEDILHAEWRHSKLSAKDAVEKHKENKLQQAKRGRGKETSLRAIAALKEDIYDSSELLEPFPDKEIEVDIKLMMGDEDAKDIGSGEKMPFGKFLRYFGRWWRERGYSGSDSDFIRQGLENHIRPGLLTYEEIDDAMDYFWDN